jgi:hypothetical protein
MVLMQTVFFFPPMFFAVSKTEYDKGAGSVLHLAITGYNKGSIDNLMTEGNSQHSSKGGR